MRAILDLRTRKVLRNCGSIVSSMRTFAMLQIERDKQMRLVRQPLNNPRNFCLAICEVQTVRHVGSTVPEGEFTIIHQEK